MSTSALAVLRGTRVRFAGRPWLADAALGGGLSLLDAATLLARDPAPSPSGALLWAAQTVPLLWRRRRPRTVLAAMTVLFALFEALDPVPGKTPGPYFLIFGVYAVARYRPVRDGLTATALALAAATAAELLTGRAEPPRPDSLNPDSPTAFAAYFAVAFLLGCGRRRIEADARRLRDLNDRLRAERETNARQAVVAERARIAGELHDVVAHHVSAIAVQARSTEDALTTTPPSSPRDTGDIWDTAHVCENAHVCDSAYACDVARARDTADTAEVVGVARQGVVRIAETADTALVEMRRILGLLSVGGDGEGAEPSLAHLDRLVQAAEAAGCRVSVAVDAVTGPAGALPAALQASAYRVVREAVTNVLKHAGPVGVAVVVARDASALRVEVVNGPPGDGHRPVPGSGRGLLGMRERVTAFGGTLDAGPTPDGGWRVAALIPLEERR
ncbi:sensor histidine kinase [Actinomadura oligospora]|uniref:sensor histidine kinase n=1 Tax=Actinomadura oligospora TaxID=111804 RepID=UPI00047ABD83|nr:histidine kinase [Actinomadura oligospora]